ncbi:MAG: hypothetical protein WBA09_22510 [Candidatus Acidiferrum sp.]
MSEKIEGFLEVGTDDGEVVVNHPDLKPDENGVGHIVFSPNQARNLAELLVKQARVAEQFLADQREAERLKNIPEVDRTKRCMLSGSKETPEHREIEPSTGMQKDYVVLCPGERAKGFVRPVRRTYRHLLCNTTTTMGLALAETYARDPEFYSGTFCCHCRTHFPLDQFVWEGTKERVGS